MFRKSWMMIPIFLVLLSAARGDDSGSPAEQSAAPARATLSGTLCLLDEVRSRGFVDLGNGDRLSAARVARTAMGSFSS